MLFRVVRALISKIVKRPVGKNIHIAMLHESAYSLSMNEFGFLVIGESWRYDCIPRWPFVD